MPPSPTIPTSFVPKQSMQASSNRPMRSGGNVLMMIAVFLLGLAIVGSIGVFAYERFLEGSRDKKAYQVGAAQAALSPDSVENFIRTRDRFTSASTILDNHVAASQFFDVLESLTLESVRFESLSFGLAEDRSAELHIVGTARSFNALAGQSSALASEKRIKSAIFSGITVNPTGTVSFALDASLDPRLLVMAVPETIPEMPVEEMQEESSLDTPTLQPTTPQATTTPQQGVGPSSVGPAAPAPTLSL